MKQVITADPERHPKNNKRILSTTTHINLTTVDVMDEVFGKHKFPCFTWYEIDNLDSLKIIK